jgi:hypothetical protein
MKVVVSRSGGFAGLRVTWDLQVDEQPDAAAWMKFLEDLPWDEAEDTTPAPDRYVYRIRCAPHEVVLAEPQVHGAWKDLIDRVRAASER